jgi:23S rRNA pseudouridine2604 synthase
MSDPRRSEAPARRSSELPTRNSEGYAPRPPRSDAPRGDTARGDMRRNDTRGNEMRSSRSDSTRSDTRSSRSDTRSSRSDNARADTRSTRPDTRGNSRADVRSNRTEPASHAGSAHNVASHSAQTPRINMQDGVRLSKRMSEEGLASRREADQWIERGWVKVDGQIVAELGTRVLPTQQITVDERARNQQAQQVTILLNKPVGYVSGQAEDGHLPAVTLIKPENHWAEDTLKMRLQNEHLRGLAPAGRLDIDSVGLLVLTQNGRVAKQLIGANSSIDKEYLVRVKYLRGEQLPEDQLALLNHGLELDGVPLQPARVEWQNEDQLRFVLREGKKRQIRRMCEMVGLEVLGLKRVRIGRVRLGGLPTGQWRYLGPDEIFWAD